MFNPLPVSFQCVCVCVCVCVIHYTQITATMNRCEEGKETFLLMFLHVMEQIHCVLADSDSEISQQQKPL